jgi:hypothetical protein
MAALSSFIVTRKDWYVHDCKDGAAEYVYHDRTAWHCAVFVGKRYGNKGYPQRDAAHVR